ncbi:MAG: DUF4214 domain-containing protein [bacterium]|nr:DUF4214 domain-containing protein [bacterium]
MSKKRVGFVTSSILLKTGFSHNAKNLLPYLWKTGRYEILHLNQGMGETPEFGRLPWKNDAAMKHGLFDPNRFNSDPGYQRDVSYGNYAVEKFVIENKLDYLVLIEDGWSFAPDFYFKSKWWSLMKNNTLLWTTCDSLPVLPLFKEWSQNCPNVWFWASFGVKALQQEDPEKYKHLKWVFGALNTQEWNPISQKEKIELKKKNNIDPNTFLFLQLGRNQLRKIFPATIESFAKFKKLHPEHKAKLHFHCSYSDQGWPLQRLTTELGLKNEDVLVTYFCRGCSEWEVKPFTGEDQDCRFCGGQKSQITAGVTSTISNRELSKVIGMSDACVSCYTSGGYEYVNPQALLCELPLLCTEYSSGEDFVNQDFVFRLDGNYTFEQGTGFKKHVPNQNTIVKFFKKICEMPLEKRKEIGQKGREWALKTFDVNIIGKQVEEWIDNTPKHNWDFTLPKVELKDPNAIIDNIPDNGEFVEQLYNRVLKVKSDPQGKSYWINLLTQGSPREQIISQFRNIAAADNQKNQTSQQSTELPFEPLLRKNNKKRLLIVAKEAIGDLLYVTALSRSFRESYPADTWDIYIACDPQYEEIFHGNEFIDVILPYNPIFENELQCTGVGSHKGWFDSYCFVPVLTQRFLSYITNDNINLALT